MKVIGVDIGTTSIGVVVMDTEAKKLITSKTIPNGGKIETENDWERIQNAGILIKNAKNILDDFLGQHPDVKAIGLTGQQHGIVYLNAEGEHISPLYTWEDGRGAQPEFDGESVVSLVKGKYGLPVATGYGLVTHLYHCKKGLVPEGAVTFCTIMDYLGMVLTGRKKPLVHTSNASGFGFFDNAKFDFCRDVIAECGMDLAMLPEVSGDVEVLGTYKNLPVTIGIGDNQTSFLGSVGTEEGVWLLDAGTGGRLSVLSDICFEAPGIEARPFLGDKYLLNGSTLCAGRAYAILETFFRGYAQAIGVEGDQYGVMAQLAEKADKDAGGMVVVPKFNGTRVNPEIRGTISGISVENLTPENLTMALVRGIAQEFYDMYEKICEGTGMKANYLLGSGNACRKNKALRETIEDMFQAKIVMADLSEEAACGAALSTIFAKGIQA